MLRSLFLLLALLQVPAAQSLRAPLHQVVDLNVDEQTVVTLRDGARVNVRLVAVDEPRDQFRAAVREPKVTVEVNAERVETVCGNYRLPVDAGGVQIDCPITRGVVSNATEDSWGLDKAARIRVWPSKSPWVEAGTFMYPARQTWFASGTQMSAEPTHVDGGEVPANKRIYYHSGLDIGGAEGMVDVVAATDGLVVSSGTTRLPGHEGTPVAPRYDVVYLLDERGWYYRYSHLKTIETAVSIGARVKMGQKIGVLGKEGGSGGWAHLHFEIKSRQPSGKWGTEDGYAFLWQTYVSEFRPQMIAVARPHKLAAVGDTVMLDGSRSWSPTMIIAPLRQLWLLSDGTSAPGPKAFRKYDRPGTFSEVLRVTNANGRLSYDFTSVQVIDPAKPADLPPTIQAAYSPTSNIAPGDPVTFKTRTFRTRDGEETWDFGDDTPRVTVKSDGNANIHDPNGFAVTEHRFARPGDYIVRVSRTNANGLTATAHLWVHVGARR